MVLQKRRNLLLGGLGLTAVSTLFWLQQRQGLVALSTKPSQPVNTAPTFTLEPFRPAYTNPHIQTLLSHSARSQHGVTFRRERIELPDGDFIDLDFADVVGQTWAQLGDEAPIVLVLHGLEGTARRSYTNELYRQLAQRGIRAAGMNFRSCSGEQNRLPRMYHAGETADLAYIFNLLQTRYPNVNFGLAGFSLGGNILLKFLGEEGKAMVGRVKTAVAISPPFDMANSARVLDYGSGWPYRRYLMHKMQQKLVERESIMAGTIDYDRALRAKTFHEFDDACTAPLNGFKNAYDYYAQTSSQQFLPHIEVPTLIIRAEDDPFFAADIPYQAIAQNRNLYSGIVRHGGHVGFMEGSRPDHLSFWSERQAARFIAHHTLLKLKTPAA